ncbi:MAG: tetratricopeptide repeat protein [Polyangiales bacterium]|nr:tetratricopeptide repeat protein [Myxococcales bacterium]
MRNPLSTPIVRALVVALVAACALPAAAQAPVGEDQVKLDEEAARGYFKAGESHYQAGRFKEAAEAFVKAYELSKLPPLLKNAYVGYRDAGMDAEAAAALRSYLEVATDEPDRLRLESSLATLEEKVKAREAQEAAALEQQQAAAEETTAPETEESAGPGPWPWVVVGVGGAALVTGVVLAIVANGKYSDLEADCPDNACPDSVDIDGRTGDISTFAGLADGLMIGGAVVAGLGVLWYFLSADDEEQVAERERDVRVVGGCGPTGCVGGVQWAF